MKNSNKKGFTLAELLVVVAIIGVLVAIAIPTFTAQLKKAKIAADDANIRAAYAMMKSAELTDDLNGTDVSDANAGTFFLQKDGTVSASNTIAGSYVLQENHTGCSVPGFSDKHTKGEAISITKSAGSWTLDSVTGPTS